MPVHPTSHKAAIGGQPLAHGHRLSKALVELHIFATKVGIL